jgi:magnesium chelatase subunit D
VSLARPQSAPGADAMLAAVLFAIDTQGMSGIALRSRPPDRDRWLGNLCGLLPRSAPIRRLPIHIADGRLLGGLDLPATLRAGRPVAERGILAEADSGLLVVTMAERQSAATLARLTAALDRGEVVMERDGLAVRNPARFGLVALDEGIDDDERPPAALLDRMAFHLTLDGWDRRAGSAGQDAVAGARARLPAVFAGDDIVAALCTAAAALGIDGARPVLMALAAARAHAALAGQANVTSADAAVAARLVLAPRATRLPVSPPEEEEPATAAAPPDRGGEQSSENGGEGADDGAGSESGEMVVAAAKAAIPPDLLARLRLGQAGLRGRTAGRSGIARKSGLRGRPVGVRRSNRRNEPRLNLIETLRAAAPWQAVRKRGVDGAKDAPRVIVRQEDLRITRFKQKTETTTIFVVDASGSSAFHRLAEAKGAVELLLADCYVRRDRVALVAMRAGSAEVLLPPTRSLARAKRNLATLPGGGGTALATGIDVAAALAGASARSGRTPIMVFLTDGRPNVKRDGTAGREGAEEEALAAARMVREAGFTALLVDTSPRPRPFARSLADQLGSTYLVLPSADARTLSRAVTATVGNRRDL